MQGTDRGLKISIELVIQLPTRATQHMKMRYLLPRPPSMESPPLAKRSMQQEAGPSQRKGTSQSRVEECEEPVGDESGQAQPEA